MKKIKIRDILDYKFPENPHYSPDGKQLAFQVSHADEKTNSYKRNVHLYRSGKVIQLTSLTNTSIVMWDDNDTLILRRSTEETEAGCTDLYKISTKGGEAEKWLSLPFGMNSMKKASDHLYYVTADIEMNDPDAYLDDEKTRKEKQAKKKQDEDYTVVDELPYYFNGAGFVNGHRTALFEVKTDPLKIRRITSSSFDTGSVCVEGYTVYFTGKEWTGVNDMHSKIYAYDGKKVTPVFEEEGYSLGSLFVMDGQLYTFASDGKEYGVNETGTISKVVNGTLEKVMKPEISLYCSAAGDTLLGGGKQMKVNENILYSIITEEDHCGISSFDKDMHETRLLNVRGIVSCMDVSDRKIAYVKEDATHTGEIYEFDLKSKREKKLTDLNSFENKYVARPERIDYEAEGDQLHGFVLLPENYGSKKKYPAVLDIHGGPRTIYSEAFFHEMQVWAAKGYVVMFTNIRGSDGRGDAFADIRGDYGGTDYKQLMAFTDKVLESYPLVDRSKVCVTGGSYGGFMTNWIITQTDRFCCAASQRSISNWISFAFISDIGEVFAKDQCGAKSVYGDENTKIMWDHSPLKYAHQCKTPTLFIHSDEDYRCPLAEGTQMMQALRYNGIETKMVIFHGENHELSRSGKPLHRIRRLQEITDWFEKHTKKGKKK